MVPIPNCGATYCAEWAVVKFYCHFSFYSRTLVRVVNSTKMCKFDRLLIKKKSANASPYHSNYETARYAMA